VIEFIGGGKSSRALVRKGQWSLLQRTGPAGEMLTVLDEKHVPVPNAVVWLEGRKYAVDEKTGYILVPFTQNPGQQTIILADAAGEFATFTNFEHHAESYKLDAQFHLEREQLLAGKQATLAVHAGLLLGDAQVSLELLTDAVLTIASTTLDGITVTNEVKAPKFDPAKAFTHSFVVPERLASLRITLHGKVANLSKGGEKQDVNAGANWEVNGIEKTELTSDGHLSKTSDGYIYELLGKNGEPLADQQVVFQLRHRDFQHQVYAPLKTDDRGRIALGALAELREVKARTPNNRERQWDLRDFERTWPTALHAKVGDVLQVPLPGALLAGADPAALQRAVSLLEVRAGTYTADRRAAIKVAGGFLTIEGLAAGDYALRIYEPTGLREIPVRVTAGKVVKNWLVSPNRSLEVREAVALQITGIKPAADDVTVQLANWDKFTRVHVAATRFLPGGGLWHLGGFARFSPAWSTPDRQPSLFAVGREIGDEYRYILERRYSTIFPGNSLTRPGLLLNPWEVRSTDLRAQEMAAMAQAAATAGGRGGNRAPAAPAPAPPPIENPTGKESPNLDFLAEAAPVILNLTPDEQGLLHIDRKALGDRQQIQVYAENLTSAVWRTLAVGDVQAKFEDQRLTRNLDPTKPFTEKKTASVLTSGKSLTLANILTSELEKYDSLASVHSLYLSLSGDAKLAQFGWLLKWPELKPEEKRAKYSEFACHELSFFLSRKDPEFFAKVIVPYLANKKDKTFMDEYLLKSDLRHWLQPWSYARLNIAERCLLAQRLPGESAAAARHLRELWELLPPDHQRIDVYFETALRGLQLGDRDGDFKAAKQLQLGGLNTYTGSTVVSGGILRRNAAGDLPVLAAAVPAASPMSNVSALKAASEELRASKGEKEAALSERQAGRKGLEENGAFAKSKAADGKLGREMDKDMAELRDATVAPGFFGGEEMGLQRALVRPFFRALGPTREWAENNYYLLPIAEQNGGLITVNQFWRDFAEWNGEAPFLSSHLAEASRNFPEMMLALGVLDLPFTSPKHETKTDGGKYTLTAGGPLVAFHKEILPATQAKGNSELLVSQNFYTQGDRYREEGNERFDKYVTDEFLTDVVYGANIVVTNPTSTPQKLDVLLQIPKGALPVLGSKPTDSKHVQLAPYTTQTFEYWFYFPAPSPEAGQPFPHYPVHVARNEESVGAAKPFTFHVVRQLTQIDKTSWDYISQYGTEDEVFTFLEANNLARLNLERIAWRVRADAKFFQRLLAVLATHHIYNDVIYSYAVVHNNSEALAEWLRHRDDFIAKLGPALKSKLLVIDPIERRTYEHLEYSPLVNQRAHRVGPENRIANPVLRAQYQNLLKILAHAPGLEPMDEMSVVYYLFLQDRVEEALARFHTIAAAQLPTRLQHDYFRCYAAFYEENLAEARGLAAQYADYPVDKWRKLFVEVAGQLDELAEAQPSLAPVKLDQPDRAVQQSELASTEPSFEFKVENKQVALTWKNLSAVTVNYYLMEPEFLFSSSPFVTEDSGRFSVIKPTKSATVELPKGKDTLEFPLPPEFAKANVLVEILGAGQRHAQAYHANSFKLALTENYGRLELREQSAGKFVSKAYVKVYARLRNGTVRFFKDGYTDLRGKFDYASLNSSTQEHLPVPLPRAAERGGESGGDKGLNYQMLKPEELDQVERLSILVLHDAYGALTREVNPPSK
jgi:autotransporter-associated beta strand protein